MYITHISVLLRGASEEKYCVHFNLFTVIINSPMDIIKNTTQ